MIIESFVAFMNKIMFFSSYVEHISHFPKALSPEEEKQYISKLNKGDKEAKDILIAHNLRLVAHIVKKYSNSTKDADDLISVGTIGLIKAINSYSYDKGAQLSTYAARCIENEILMLFRTNKKRQNDISLEECIGTEKDGSDMMLGDVICDERDMVEEINSNILNEKLISIIKDSVTDREYKILSLRYGFGGGIAYTQREVAKKMGISRSYISRLEKKALASIRQEIKQNNVFVDA